MNASEQGYSVLLRQAGLRVTSPRIAILTVLDEFAHSDAEFVKEQVMKRLGTVSTQAVYDTLNSLTYAGIIRRVEPKGIRAVYEIDSNDNHHHFVCRLCHELVDIACAKGEKPCIDPVIGVGYVVDEAEVIYWGYCPECVDKVVE